MKIKLKKDKKIDKKRIKSKKKAAREEKIEETKEKGGKLVKKIFIGAIVLCIVAFVINCLISGVTINKLHNDGDEEYVSVVQGEEYSSYYDVAEYINAYHELPPNYMTKTEAHLKGWFGGNPQEKIEGNVYIGGDRFKNREGLLPDGVTYYECDVDYYDDTRGENRLIYTKDGKVYYTSDHYESFSELY